jgi:uncharacterized protein (TIGR02687 family)
MQVKQLEQGLALKFSQKNIVFWYDAEQSFIELINQINLPNVTILNMGNESSLEIKKRIVKDEREKQYLLFFPFEEPQPKDNWLLDIRLYSEIFYADSSSLILNRLQIKSMALREHVKRRMSFFKSETRLASLERKITENENDQSLDFKMISVLANCEATLSSILMVVFEQYAELLIEHNNVAADIPQITKYPDLVIDDEKNDLIEALPVIAQFIRHNLLDSFFKSLKKHYGYESNEERITELLFKLFCTDLYIHIDVSKDEKNWAVPNLLNTNSGRASASAFMLEWRDSNRYREGYNEISLAISNELNITARCSDFLPQAIKECFTFKEVDKQIIKGLLKHLVNDFDNTDASLAMTQNDFEQIISQRSSGHWGQVESQIVSLYEAIKYADRLLQLRKHYEDGFNYSSASVMFAEYSKSIFKFDKYYRLFNYYSDSLESKSTQILETLSESIEYLYVDWYLYELGLAWDLLLTKENRLQDWSSLTPNMQSNFFYKHVKAPIVDKSLKRIIVIISDALRYEVADELVGKLNQEKKYKSTIQPMLGVLPSYTQLGMASLLPHNVIDYDKNNKVCVDGKASESTKDRSAILSAQDGIGITAKELKEWSSAKAKESIQGKSIIYIYHNTIDAIGDDSKTEHKTFEACQTAIDELKDLTTKAMTKFTATRVLITADHGFIYQQRPLEKQERSVLKSDLSNAFLTKKRYAVGRDLPKDDSYWHGGLLGVTSKANKSDVEFILPKGANRFHFVGGAKFVHGGAMPQEICVPLVEVKKLTGSKATQNEKIKVGLIAEKSNIRLVNQIEKVRFIQTNVVGGNFVECRVTAVIKDSKDEVVSSEEILVFDSTSNDVSDRTREARFKLVGSNFDRTEKYNLFVTDIATNTPIENFPKSISIDLLNQDDFGF